MAITKGTAAILALVAFAAGFLAAVAINAISDPAAASVKKLTAERDQLVANARDTREKAKRAEEINNRVIGMVRQLQELSRESDSEKAALLAELAEKNKLLALDEEIIRSLQQVAAENSQSQSPPQRNLSRRNAIDENEGFSFRNVSFTDEDEIMGEIYNGTGKDWEMANFNASIYDAGESLVDVTGIVIMNIRSGQTKPFRFHTDNGVPSGGSYDLQFDSGY